ncbi:glycoside hydrolase family 35 protein [Microbacterium sp. Root180]|uniref:glycoside hydrolase family 35 protein n=1 Tax=Microbacterium sp. Root180 TaxID=1736483 RepID=UPI0006FF811E|nr:glycoside hydrolase family 35 protein [Microbacterium sp. Root180]KRB36824.1 beta-galactosidase [Microbacterium sp. Root180]
MAVFSIGEKDFLLDGRPHRVISGAIHYFRVHPDQWADRIRKARLMGLNTIETYVAWNAHEPRRGEWDATGWNDLGRFLDAVAAEGMHAIVRPGPYICAEWHNGGFPVWLTSIRGIRLRTSDPVYMAEVTRYLERVYEIVAPRQIDRGGNVVLAQIENEYGAYGSDAAYLRELVELTRDAGITVPLTTVDQPVHDYLENGMTPGVHATGSFGSRAGERLETLRSHQPTGPLMCAEFWDGWFDWWGGSHHTTDPHTTARELDALLAAGASVNIYMFHGGTNYGLTNGANHKGRYLPIVTSYDYDAPLDEAGNPTEKYWAMRDVIAKYVDLPDEAPAEASAAPQFDVPLVGTGDWQWSAQGDGRVFAQPPSFEEISHDGALVIYEAELPADAFADGEPQVLEVGEVRDRAWVSVDGRRVGTLSRSHHQHALAIPRGGRVRILVEEQGRVNYDGHIGELKGLIGSPTIGGLPIPDWTARPVDLGAVARAAACAELKATADGSAGGRHAGPVALRGEFALEAQTDLFLDTRGWGKGFAYVNGFFLGRYWANGPQRTMYVPAPVTRVGENRIVVVELEDISTPAARFVAGPELGPTEE